MPCTVGRHSRTPATAIRVYLNVGRPRQTAGADTTNFPSGMYSCHSPPTHADASKSRAISSKRLLERDSPLRTEGDTLFALTAHAEPTEMPAGLRIAEAIALRQERLANLAKANAV